MSGLPFLLCLLKFLGHLPTFRAYIGVNMVYFCCCLVRFLSLLLAFDSVGSFFVCCLDLSEERVVENINKDIVSNAGLFSTLFWICTSVKDAAIFPTLGSSLSCAFGDRSCLGFCKEQV